MSLKLWLSARTPYATQPSSIDLTLLVCNLGAEPVRGPEPDGTCLETSNERGERLSWVPCGPSPFASRELDLLPQSFHPLLTISSRASGSPRDVGVYKVHCIWQGATSNVVEYRVFGDRAPYVATMRAVSTTAIEVVLTNNSSAAIEWPKPCSEHDLTLRAVDGTILDEVELTGDTLLTQVAPGQQAALRFEVPGALRGVNYTGHFVREPFVTGPVALVL